MNTTKQLKSLRAQSELETKQSLLAPMNRLKCRHYRGFFMPNFAPLIKAGSKGVDALVDALRAFKGPQEEAMLLAQQRAALPVEKGGLGLHPANTASERAAAMEFDIPTYHGTNAPNITAVDMSKSNPSVQYMNGFFTADNPQLANNFGEIVMPLMQKKGVTLMEKRAARQAGLEVPELDTVYDKAKGILVTNNPDNLRSRFAAFDPFRKTAATATAMGVAAPDLLAEELRKK